MIAPIGGMNNDRLTKLIERVAQIIDGNDGFWHIRYQNRELWVITDECFDRMRVMTPILQEESLTSDDYRILLLANFDRALDAKYALSQGALWSIFVHPLSDLSERQFFDAVQQVHKLADNYGTTYTSTDLTFDAGE